MSSPAQTRPPGIDARYLVPCVLVTSLFSLWGFANDITNPMVAAVKNILLISHFESSLVQAAFYGGYCFMANFVTTQRTSDGVTTAKSENGGALITLRLPTRRFGFRK